jgi:hypothetical protein
MHPTMMKAAGHTHHWLGTVTIQWLQCPDWLTGSIHHAFSQQSAEHILLDSNKSQARRRATMQMSKPKALPQDACICGHLLAGSVAHLYAWHRLLCGKVVMHGVPDVIWGAHQHSTLAQAPDGLPVNRLVKVPVQHIHKQ